MSESIKEAAFQLDAAVREVRRLPWGESPPGTAKVLADYEAKKRVLALASARHVRMIPGWYEGHESDAAMRDNMNDEYDALLAQIANLGR